MMLYPTMADLLKKVNNRYKLVIVTAKRARDVAQEAEEKHEPLTRKAVSIALEEINDGKIEVAEDEEEVSEN